MTVVRETIPSALDGERVDRVVALLVGLSRAEVSRLVDGGGVRLDGRPVRQRSLRVGDGDVIEIDVPAATEAPGPAADADVAFAVVHEDEHLIVVDKPADLVVHPGAGHTEGTLVHGLLARYPELAGVGDDPARPGIVHRLDRGTSGLLLVARTPAAHSALVAALAARHVERVYRSLVWGHPDGPRGMVDAPVGRSGRDRTRMAVTERGRPARTRYEVLATFDEPVAAAELRCRLETGRTHQIRVHLASIGHAVVGDVRYGGARGSFPLARPFLHAEELGLQHPLTGAPLRFRSALPEDLEAARALLR